ncbi:DUF3347 domain-containing protein [Pedobacter sp. PWIIR3]
MKKIMLIVAFVATIFVQAGFTQENKGIAILPSYYSLKDALVVGNAAIASTKAEELTKAINGADEKLIDKSIKAVLSKQTAVIAKSKDIKAQREQFSALSTGIIALAKTAKLSAEPAYVMYCPMKKSSWLSSEKAVKNPYYGSAMLTCGSVQETISK